MPNLDGSIQIAEFPTMTEEEKQHRVDALFQSAIAPTPEQADDWRQPVLIQVGSSIDELLIEDGILEEVNLIAEKRVIAWQQSN